MHGHAVDYENVSRRDGLPPVRIVTFGAGGLVRPLRNISSSSKIYVMGHGEKGGHTIFMKDNEVRVHDLKYDQLADRICNEGLLRSWMGEIVLLNCSSGVGIVGMQSFAAKFAQWMRTRKHYYLARYAGYLGPVSTFPHDFLRRVRPPKNKDEWTLLTQTTKPHKYVELPGGLAVESKHAKVYF